MFKGTLLPYQHEAVNRMVDEKTMLVAYEMGLGKTPIAIAAIERLRDSGEMTKPVLVIALSMLKYQWEKEIIKFSDSRPLVVEGTKLKREEHYLRVAECDYLIVNYEQIVNDWDFLKNIEFSAVICDEATAIKGFKSKRSKAVKKLSKDVPIRYALTGTPLENGRPEELYSLMQFVDPSVLGRFDLFDQTFIVRNHYGGVQRYRNLPIFHERMKRSSVRKMQKDPDVSPYLPETIHYSPILVPFDKKGAAIYKRILEDLRQNLTEAKSLFGSSFSLEAHYGKAYQPGSPSDILRGQIMSKITALRLLVDSPSLLLSSAAKFKNGWQTITTEEDKDGITEQLTMNIEGSRGGSAYIAGLLEEGALDGIGVGSPKLDAVITYVLDHLEIDDTHKVVIFSCYLGVLPLIQEALREKKIESRLYSGELSAKEKEKAKVEFQTTKEIKVLISSDAGGYGVDLPQANLLVNFDLPWSAGTAVQRNSRIRRASSTWARVVIQDFLVLGSIEERQHQMLSQKNAVADAVMDGTGINDKGGVDLTVGSLLEFIQNSKI